MSIACIQTSWTDMRFPVSPSLFFSTRGSSRSSLFAKSSGFLLDSSRVQRLHNWKPYVASDNYRKNTSNKGITVIISDEHAMLQYLRSNTCNIEPSSRRKKSFKNSFVRNIFVNINFILLLMFILA